MTKSDMARTIIRAERGFAELPPADNLLVIGLNGRTVATLEARYAKALRTIAARETREVRRAVRVLTAKTECITVLSFPDGRAAGTISYDVADPDEIWTFSGWRHHRPSGLDPVGEAHATFAAARADAERWAAYRTA